LADNANERVFALSNIFCEALDKSIATKIFIFQILHLKLQKIPEIEPVFKDDNNTHASVQCTLLLSGFMPILKLVKIPGK
jgi:hypothetical protein